jgi:hypothetical protein
LGGKVKGRGEALWRRFWRRCLFNLRSLVMALGWGKLIP